MGTLLRLSRGVRSRASGVTSSRGHAATLESLPHTGESVLARHGNVNGHRRLRLPTRTFFGLGRCRRYKRFTDRLQ